MTISTFDTSISTLTEESGSDPFESFGYHSRQSTLAPIVTRQPARSLSNLLSPFSSDGSDASPVVATISVSKARRPPPPALTLTRAIELRREKVKIVAVSAEVDGRSIKEKVVEADDPESGMDSSAFGGESPGEVAFARVGTRVVPDRKPSMTRIRRTPSVGVQVQGAKEGREQHSKRAASSKVSLRSLWRAGAAALPANPRSGLPVAQRQGGRIRGGAGGQAEVSRWSDSTGKTKSVG